MTEDKEIVATLSKILDDSTQLKIALDRCEAFLPTRSKELRTWVRCLHDVYCLMYT